MALTHRDGKTSWNGIPTSENRACRGRSQAADGTRGQDSHVSRVLEQTRKGLSSLRPGAATRGGHLVRCIRGDGQLDNMKGDSSLEVLR